MTTYTLTFGDQSENHVGMQMNGKISDEGYSVFELENIKNKLLSKDVNCNIIYLNQIDNNISEKLPEAGILIIKNGIELFGVNSSDMYMEQNNLEYDKKAFMYGRVVNKLSRHNICFSDYKQNPDYENKKGRIVAFNDLKILNIIKNKLPEFFGDKAYNLQCEGNKYYDINKCYIGWHGDGERKIVIGFRFGEKFPLYFRWYKNGKIISEDIKIELNSGDIYIMSEKAVGFDWKKKRICTLRHCAGYNIK